MLYFSRFPTKITPLSVDNRGTIDRDGTARGARGSGARRPSTETRDYAADRHSKKLASGLLTPGCHDLAEQFGTPEVLEAHREKPRDTDRGRGTISGEKVGMRVMPNRRREEESRWLEDPHLKSALYGRPLDERHYGLPSHPRDLKLTGETFRPSIYSSPTPPPLHARLPFLLFRHSFVYKLDNSPCLRVHFSFHAHSLISFFSRPVATVAFAGN